MPNIETDEQQKLHNTLMAVWDHDLPARSQHPARRLVLA